MDIITAKNAPEAIGPYSHAVTAGGFVFTSGQLGLDSATGVLPEGIEAQSEQAIKNLGEVLRAAGLGFADVVKTTCFLKSMDDFAAFNAVYAKYFTGKPARSCVAVAALPKGALVEVEAVASKE
ncbi:MAG: RidA family protein [Oscillospiraceae bacterium]|nr:RidA family protein [Oscillospiraceae bacterium]